MLSTDFVLLWAPNDLDRDATICAILIDNHSFLFYGRLSVLSTQ